ncbi:hypothetical protein CHS0354_017634 [Potamilus streckersoni]|uniref:Uncharacterized protein n=1 Tax=Potamilus streckersoni TaxID=2493646 RepID=A0AAE0T1T2_9BIVA|nr:hypothetical protein CHS0354_017634 [Potamilus streckersoni]
MRVASWSDIKLHYTQQWVSHSQHSWLCKYQHSGMDILSRKGSFVATRLMVKGCNDDMTVKNIDQCEDEYSNEVINKNIETTDTDQRDMEVDKLSAMNAGMLSKQQTADISLQSI